eukprot:CAMPEP_0185315906 /NCGR_PEP_ID=MMETSP1363-20130426/42631_1 /TAXON_ID=38817 /ORGANISM="Gephyrocapsa oceanica, Strain RCC1303" /LENGTH=158 /DNA_ID=CAMNT_0027914045 /DNA_START=49 /DNA_END=521 /DNA_ORIENTATION=+
MDEAFHCEALEHYRGLSKYVSGVGWTHLLLPTLGGPTNSTVLELVRRKASGPYVVYMWLYVACMTRLCWWCYSLSAERALPPPLTHRSSAPACEIAVGRARAAVWVHISGSLVRIATWAWVCALLSVLHLQRSSASSLPRQSPSYLPVQSSRGNVGEG